MAHRVALVAAHERVDRTVEGGREQQGLARFRCAVEQALHDGQEAHVGHAVGFVDDDHLDRVEVDLASFDQVGQAAGAGDEDVDAVAQRFELISEAGAAVDGGDPQLAGSAEPQQLVAHLRGELAGGDQHEPAWAARLGPLEASDQRDAEGEGLAGAGRCPAAEVAAGAAVGQGQGLDGEGLGNAASLESGDDVGGNAEIGEG